MNKEDLIEALVSISDERIPDKMSYIESDVWEADKDTAIVTCVACDLRNEGISRRKGQNPRVGECVVKVDTDGRIIVYFVTKEHNSSNPSYHILESCVEKLKDLCKQKQISKIAIPKYNSGMDKLPWELVSSVMNKTLVNEGIQCYVHTGCRAKSQIDLDLSKRIGRLQNQDEETAAILQKVKRNEAKGFAIEDGVLVKLRQNRNKRIFRQLVVPKSMRHDVLKMCHDDFTGAHLGQKKTITKLNNRFYWPSSINDTIHYVKSCEVCARIKNPPPERAVLKPITEFEKPFDMVAVDILELSTTSCQNKYVVVFTDYLTKWVEAFPLRNMTAEAIAKVFVNEVITRHSAPSKLLSDQGRNFLSDLVKSVCTYFKINKVQTAPYHPQCDGLVERFNRTLCQMLSAYANSNQTNWDLYLPLVLFAYRTSIQATTNDSPFELLYGREPRLGDLDNLNKGYEPGKFISDLHERWTEARNLICKQAEINKKIYDGKYKRNPTTYRVNDYVRVKRQQTRVGLKKKLRNDHWSEPLRVSKVVCDQNVEVEIGNKTKIVNVNNIKKKEPTRSQEIIRKVPTVTRYGRTSRPTIRQ